MSYEPRVVSLREANYDPVVSESGISLVEARKKHVDFLVAHEQQDPLQLKNIFKTGKSAAELSKEMATVKDLGFRQVAEDFEKIQMQEIRLKPKLYLCHYTGDIGTITDWINGTDAEFNGIWKRISPPHLRTWCLSGVPNMAGVTLPESDHNKSKKYWQSLVEKGEYSELVELDWKDFQKLR